MQNKDHRRKYFPYFIASVFFIALFIAGLLIYKDYGVPFDEPYLIQLAILNHIYILKSNPALLTEFYRYYGMVFELPLFWVASRFAGPDSVYIRHLLLFLAFLASLIIFYLLSLRLFRNPWWGLLAVSMLALSPRIFSDSFYNSKDVAFMDVFILAIWTLTLAIDVLGGKWLPTSAHIFVHSLASSLLIGIRIVGVMIIPLSILLLAIESVRLKLSWKKLSFIILSYLFLTTSLTILFWPVLWHDPYNEFVSAFQQMSQFNVYGKAVLFKGAFIPSDTLPWDYLPVWIGISTPIIVLIGFVIGIGNWSKNTPMFAYSKKYYWVTKQKDWISGSNPLHWLAIIYWVTIPILSLYIFNSVIYNSWRHLFFVYPAIVLFSARGFASLHKWLSEVTGRQTLVTFLTLLLLWIGFAEPIEFLSRHHRYGIVYF